MEEFVDVSQLTAQENVELLSLLMEHLKLKVIRTNNRRYDSGLKLVSEDYNLKD